MSQYQRMFLLLAIGYISFNVFGCQKDTSDMTQETFNNQSGPANGSSGKATDPELSGQGSNADHSNVLAVNSRNTEVDPTGFTLEVGDESDLERLLEKHRGRVVLVDFWATWCAPCVRQFPHTVEMSEKFGDKLAVVAVSMDDPGDIEKVRFFLNDQQVQFDNLIARYGVGQEAFEAFQIENGSVPHYKLFDNNGKLYQFADDNEKVETWIQELLEQ